MLKKTLVIGLLVVVVVAAAFSIYNTSFAAKAETAALVNSPAAAQSNGQGNGQSGRPGGAQGDGTGVPSPQNALTEWVSFSGEVTAIALPQFTLLADDGQEIPAELGNISYIEQLGLDLQVGDQVSVIGFWDPNGGFALKSLTLDETGQTFVLRDEYARPLWSGGKGQGRRSQP